MIFATGWFIRNRPIAAPDRMDLVPISFALYPNVLAPPPFVQADRRLQRSSLLVTTRAPSAPCIVLTGVSGPESETLLNTLRTKEDRRLTGHMTLSPVLSCVRLSILRPFFWFSKVTVTLRAIRRSCDVLCGITRCLASRKTIPLRRMILVRPGVGVAVISQDLIAKK